MPIVSVWSVCALKEHDPWPFPRPRPVRTAPGEQRSNGSPCRAKIADLFHLAGHLARLGNPNKDNKVKEGQRDMACGGS